MSSYYDFVVNVDLKPDTLQHVIDTLTYMTRKVDYVFDNPLGHEFFKEHFYDGKVYEAWRSILQPSAFSRMPGVEQSSFRVEKRNYTDIPSLSLRCYVHDDAQMDFWNLLFWLAPYIATQGFIGYMVDHVGDEYPDLITFKKGEFDLLRVMQVKSSSNTKAPDP